MIYPRLESADNNIDLVDFGSFRAWMLVNDQLYQGGTSQGKRNFPIMAHYDALDLGEHLKSEFTSAYDGTEVKARHFGFCILEHFLRQGLSFDVVDVGAFIGDVSLRYASFMRSRGIEGPRVFAIDPSLSGDLIPFNVRLNRLENVITHLPVAVGPVNGPLPFALARGVTDAARLAADNGGREDMDGFAQNAIVPCIRLDDFLANENVKHAFLKLDLEGYDSVCIRQIRDYLDKTFTVLAFELSGSDPDILQLAVEMMGDYAVLEVGYLPNMSHIIRHESRETLWDMLRRMPYGYTDVIAIPKKMPGFDDLMAVAGRVTAREKTVWTLTWDD